MTGSQANTICPENRGLVVFLPESSSGIQMTNFLGRIYHIATESGLVNNYAKDCGKGYFTMHFIAKFN